MEGSGAGIERSRFTLSIRACFARINILGHPGPSIAYEETEEKDIRRAQCSFAIYLLLYHKLLSKDRIISLCIEGKLRQKQRQWLAQHHTASP